ncbi:MAG: glycosyltransferase family 2 protein [Aldersonia sp.]|nr:glycosyltransferase family 2 protein [Aldersonia sp.]
MTNQLLIDAEHLAVGLGYSPTIPFETYWRVPGDYSALHSILLGSWAEGGLLAVLLPVWLLAACCALVWNNRRYGRWAPLVVLLGVQGIWDLVYSPWTYNLIPVYVCIALFFAAKHFRHTGDTGSLASTDVPADPALTVSVIVPTVGRATLDRAVRSALAQTRPPIEVIVVADTEGSLVLPVHDRIRVLRTGPRAGASRARQTGIDAARGRVIALLDDDDEWQPNKLRKQLSAASELRGDRWVISSRITVAGSGNRRRVWPRRTIEAGQSIVDYLYRFRDLTVGGAVLQSSTLVFPASLATDIRLDTDPESIHDEAGWLIRVQRAYPDLEVVQLPQALSIYHVGEASLSHSRSDRSGDYVAWGLDYLATEPARVRGDYLCTSPVSAAVSAGSAGGVRRAVAAALRNGRPGPYALAYAALNMLRIWIARLRVPDAREPAT